MRPARLVPLAVATAVVAAVAPMAATNVSASAGKTERVLLTLTPRSRGLLRALATGHASSRSHRLASLDAALPSRADVNRVAADARALGLAVDRTSRLAVLASGPAAVVDSTFGSARSVAPRSPMQHALPRLPSAFAGKVTAAFGGDDNRPAFRHFSTATGSDFRSAYGDPTTDPTGNPGVPQSIASVQLSGWHSSDLTHFASDLRTSNPAWPAPSYVGVNDPYAPASVPTDGSDIEVDLDQEAIYSVAPYAGQRAYLSANSAIGMFDSLVNIGDDAFNPLTDNHIVAATISWGRCESDLATGVTPTQLAQFYRAFEDALSYVVASGVTVFAATGDSGSDCVPYPATSPQVVAVGGTSASAPSDRTKQSGWVDTGWVPGTTDPSLGASGGGASTYFGQPAYQAGVDTGYTGGHRTIPDISALAGDPGFGVYTSSPALPSARYLTAGGTSLASPVAASTYAVALAAHGYSWGVGDILPGLYAQRADGNAFFDVATNTVNNGSDTDRSSYDRVTGIGTPIWSGLLNPNVGGDPHLRTTAAYTRTTTVGVAEHQPDWQAAGYYTGYRIDTDLTSAACPVPTAYTTPPTGYTMPSTVGDGPHDLTLTALDQGGKCHFADAFVFLDRVRPRVSARLRIVRGSTRDVVASWAARDPNGAKASGVRRVTVTLTGNGHTWHPKASPFRFTGVSGKPYTLKVTAVDRAGNATTTAARLLDDRDFRFSRYWSRSRSWWAYGRSQHGTRHRGAHAKASAPGKGYTLYVMRCASCGKLGVYLHGRRVKVVDTYARTTRYRVPVTVLSRAHYGSRTLVLRALGTKNPRSRGVKVLVDGLTTAG